MSVIDFYFPHPMWCREGKWLLQGLRKEKRLPCGGQGKSGFAAISLQHHSKASQRRITEKTGEPWVMPGGTIMLWRSTENICSKSVQIEPNNSCICDLCLIRHLTTLM